MKFFLLSIALFLFNANYLKAQSPPSFSTFKGEAYKVPFKEATKGYGKHIEQYQKIGILEWTEINVPETVTDFPFPDLDQVKLFGIVFQSTMTIKEKACYEFVLNSDDGSVLWIKDKLVLNNGISHGMLEKRDTVTLNPGTYPIKIWYVQLYPDRYGIIFNANNVGDNCPIEMKVNLVEKEKKIEENVIEKKQKLNFETEFLFNVNEFVLKEDAQVQLSEMCSTIQNISPKKILIVGHTDNTGTNEYNIDLSTKRAESIKTHLMACLKIDGVAFVSKGMGERFPVESNDNEEGRRQNRRVEIILD